ncbi:MAG TPA: RNA-guided endonuclease IscB [Candidatus Methylomirabilis sp.]|nr:RNA-guided endonuclease IscB [Candidatus Methylomirabilis sp.]
MQRLEERDTYTAPDASQVRNNCDSALNREETLSVPNLKTSSNGSDVNQLRHGDQDLRVPVMVLNMRGKPLMPTTPRKARKLLDSGNAKVVQRTPFTIQLNYPTGEAKQHITLGIDPNYTKIGFSTVTDQKELISGEVTLRDDVSENINERKQYRRSRRSKLEYRKPGVQTQNSKNEGKLSPSVLHKLDAIVGLVHMIKKILPVTSIFVEVASFDTQKMENPEISGIEYQQGELLGYEIREYLLEKYNRTCAYCGKSNVPLQVEHIIPKSRYGSDRVSNLTVACSNCNQEKGDKTAEEFGYPEVQEQAKATLKATAFMNTIRWKLIEQLDCEHTFGYITKHNRIKLNLRKSHVNDAFVIAGGTDQERTRPYQGNQTRRNNRALQTNRKGFMPSIRRKKYPLGPNDLVFVSLKSGSLICTVKGVFNYGKWVRVVDSIGNIINTNIKNVELIKYGKGLQLRFT